VSRPRKPFGATHPGRLPATMIKVLAAEMSDPQRLRRGKQYARDGSVIDIDIAPGVVTCEVQGTRATPYVASLEVRPGDGMPLRRDVTAHCTCPDDDNWDGYACKHVVATMFTFSDELLLEPELLEVWRQTEAAGPAGTEDRTSESDDGAGDDGDEGDDGLTTVSPRPSLRRRHLRLVPTGDDVTDDDGGDADTTRPDPIAASLHLQGGNPIPALPELEPLDPPAPRSEALAAALRDALAHLRIDWE
jgi:hypothetical protein